MTSEHLLRILEGGTGRETDRCTGPAADGSCPRVAIGDILPCAGCVLAPAVIGPEALPYEVSRRATLCPVTLAAAMGVAPDNLFVAAETQRQPMAR